MEASFVHWNFFEIGSIRQGEKLLEREKRGWCPGSTMSVWERKVAQVPEVYQGPWVIRQPLRSVEMREDEEESGDGRMWISRWPLPVKGGFVLVGEAVGEGLV